MTLSAAARERRNRQVIQIIRFALLYRQLLLNQSSNTARNDPP